MEVGQLKLSVDTGQLLRCPICKDKVGLFEKKFRCLSTGCSVIFPVINGIPVLINESNSLFSIEDLVGKSTTFKLPKRNKIQKISQLLIPGISLNIKCIKNCDRFAKLLSAKNDAPKVLVLGGSILSKGIKSLFHYQDIELVVSDVSFGPDTMLICDAHDIPFENASFDGVIVQAVLEHVVDPYRCTEEIYRVLKKEGVVYAETPFMQQMHQGRYDFTRFTYLGHRRLFRRFEEIDSGAVCGPGMALAWAYYYFLLSFAKSKVVRHLIRIFAMFTSFYLKYFDYYLINKMGALDAASGFYFMGKKSDRSLTDKELIKLYRGET